MKVVPPALPSIASLAFGLLLAVHSNAQPPTPTDRAAADSAHQIVIYNGATRTVHYIAPDASPTQQQTWRNAERTANARALEDQVLTLTQQYLADERRLEPYRFALQTQIASYSPSVPTGVYPDEVAAIDFNAALAFASTDISLFSAVPYGWGSFGWGNGGRWGFPAGGSCGAYGGASPASPVIWPPLDEGTLKSGILRRLTGQPAASARIELPAHTSSARAHPTGFTVTVALKSGNATTGELIGQDKDWVTLRTNAGRTQLRKSEVVAIHRP